MKWTITISMVVLAALASTAAAWPVDAGTISVSRVPNYYDPTFSGGEFTVYDTSLSVGAYTAYTTATSGKKTPANSFQTFCVERNEYIMPPYEDITTDMDIAAIRGGVAGGSPDFLDPKTAYLYTRFATGNLSNYTYTPGAARAADAVQLQNAIWYIEQEIGNAQTPEAALSGKALDWYNDADHANWTDIRYVRALNPYHESVRDEFQSQLYLAPVPLPASVLLGVFAVGLAGRKLRKLV
jgi:hypothetical protein